MGSTREGEEALLLPVITTLLNAFPDLRIICALRHVERTAEVETLFTTANGLRVQRRSTEPGVILRPGDVLLWDTFGDLMEAYRQSTIAVIGGSFVEQRRAKSH